MIEQVMTNGTPFVVDNVDADLVQVNWCCSDDGYAYRNIGPRHKRKKVFLHRLIMGKVTDRTLEKWEEVDHKNRNKQDNRRENLRIAGKTNNMRNIGPQKNNKSGYKGVCYKKDGSRRKRWVAQINIGGKVNHLGFFLTPEEAAHAYDKAALERFGEFAYLNFPTPQQSS